MILPTIMIIPPPPLWIGTTIMLLCRVVCCLHPHSILHRYHLHTIPPVVPHYLQHHSPLPIQHPIQRHDPRRFQHSTPLLFLRSILLLFLLPIRLRSLLSILLRIIPISRSSTLNRTILPFTPSIKNPNRTTLLLPKRIPSSIKNPSMKISIKNPTMIRTIMKIRTHRITQNQTQLTMIRVSNTTTTPLSVPMYARIIIRISFL